MTIYVDQAAYGKPNGRVKYCHMTADSLQELHAFAKQVGIKPHWFHRGSRYPHYDVSSDKRQMVIDAGAVEITSKELVPIAKRLYVARIVRVAS